MDTLSSWARRALVEAVPRDHRESPGALRRRRLVTLVAGVVGVCALAVSLHIRAGSRWFYPAGLVLAAVWIGGAVLAGPLHLGRIRSGAALVRPWRAPIAVGLVLAAVFAAGGVLVRLVPPARDQVGSVLDYADRGSLPLVLVITVVTGIGEELFFRGALYAALPSRPVLWTSLAYPIATLATGNPLLVLAAIPLGVVVALERRASGGVLAPCLTHVVWSVAMLLVLPPIVGV